MRILVVLFSLFGFPIWAADSKKEMWKKFENSRGFEFSYPDCSAIEFNDPDQEGKIEDFPRIIADNRKCGPAPRAQYVPNSVSFNLWIPKDLNAAFEKLERDAEFKKGVGVLYVKKEKMGVAESITIIEKEGNNYIRWHLHMKCSHALLSVMGPQIDEPDPAYIAKIRMGETSPPMPEKKIIESIRCRTPSKK